MQKVSIFVLLALVAAASANFMCCPGERNQKKEAKKAQRTTSIKKPEADFSAYTPTGTKAVFAKPSTNHAIPTAYPTGDTMNLAARKEITPVEATENYKAPFESTPKSGSRFPLPMSPTRASVVESNNISPTRATENIPTPNSSPMETRARSPMPVSPMRSHHSNSQAKEKDDEPIKRYATPPTPPTPPSFQKPSTGFGQTSPKPATESPKSQHYAKSGMNDEDISGSRPPTPPPPPSKFPNFSKPGNAAVKNSAPTMANPVSNGPPAAPPVPSKLPTYSKPSPGLNNAALTAGRGGLKPVQNQHSSPSNPVSSGPPVAPPVPSKLPSYTKPSAGLSNAALAAGRGGLKPVQTPISNPKPTQLYGKPEATETKRSPGAINAADIMASRNSLKPVSRVTSPPVVNPQSNQRSFKPSLKTSEATNDSGSGVMNLAKRFDNPGKPQGSSNPMMAEFAAISQRRNRINNIDWAEFDKTARK